MDRAHTPIGSLLEQAAGIVRRSKKATGTLEPTESYKGKQTEELIKFVDCLLRHRKQTRPLKSLSVLYKMVHAVCENGAGQTVKQYVPTARYRSTETEKVVCLI